MMAAPQIHQEVSSYNNSTGLAHWTQSAADKLKPETDRLKLTYLFLFQTCSSTSRSKSTEGRRPIVGCRQSVPGFSSLESHSYYLRKRPDDSALEGLTGGRLAFRVYSSSCDVRCKLNNER